MGLTVNSDINVRSVSLQDCVLFRRDMGDRRTHERKRVGRYVVTREDTFQQGTRRGLRAPSGRGCHLIMLHAGCEKGFVKEACLVFRAKETSDDYHPEMDGNRFEKWFVEQLLPNTEPSSVVVMDNASYHSVHLEKVPSLSTRKGDIQSWL